MANTEGFEVNNFLPGSLDRIASVYGNATVALDSSSMVNGTYSIKFQSFGSGSAFAFKDLQHEYSTVTFGFTLYLPSGFDYGASSYFTLAHLKDSEGSNVVAFNLEQWGPPENLYNRLTVSGGGIGYTDILDIPNGKTDIKIQIKKSAYDGYIKIWLGKEITETPDYYSGTMPTGSSSIQQVMMGCVYTENAISAFWLDDFIVNDLLGAPTVPLSFTWKGYNWNRRTSFGTPQFNGLWDRANAIVDGNGDLVLTITNPSGSEPYGAEITSEKKAWGYGTYTCVVEADLDGFHPNAVFGGLFTYDPLTSITANEIDICETSGWGTSEILMSHVYWKNDGGIGKSVSESIAAPSNPIITHRMIWTPGQIQYDSFDGVGTEGTLLFHTLFKSSDIPVPYQEMVLFNAWVFGGSGSPSTVPLTTIKIKDFTFSSYVPTTSIISFDTHTYSATSSWSHICSGSDRLLLVAVGVANSSNIPTITYDGVSMTLLTTLDDTYDNIFLFGLINPNEGSHTISISNVSGTSFKAFANSYNGVLQSDLPDAINSFISPNYINNLSLNVVKDNCWIVGIGGSFNYANANSTISISSLTKRSLWDNGRYGFAGAPFLITIWDSNDTVSAGENVLTFTANSDCGGSKGILLSIAPSVETALIKTINGVAIANVKTINGLARANMKTFNGLT